MTLAAYLRIWLASMRYSTVRNLMFRFDTMLWFVVEFAWMVVNIVLIEVIFGHIDSLAGWSKYEMLLLIGTSMVISHLFIGLFMTNLFEVGRNVRTGAFDFFLAQPGNPLFMVSTRKVELDGLMNTFLGCAVVIFAAFKLSLEPGFTGIAIYGLMVLCGLAIHYGACAILVSTAFWTVRSEGVETGYFTIFEFSRLPRSAFRGIANVIFVYLFPAVIVSNFPAKVLIGGPEAHLLLWLAGATMAWFWLAVLVFNRGLRRYTSASS
jgi:ABC-2 type transport system permease protein